MGYDKPMKEYWKKKGINLDDDRVQTELFENPARLVRLMDQHQVLSKDRGYTTPIFYEYAKYQSIAGAHEPKTEELLREFFRIWMPWYDAFQKKYAKLEKLWQGERGGTIEYHIGTGWQDSIPLLELAGDWFYADDIRKDCENYFRYAKELQSIDTEREVDVCTLMQKTKENLTPMAFMGLGHTLRVEKLTKPWATTHVLTPMSVTHLDHKRSTTSADDDESPILNLTNYRQLHHLASNVPPLKKS